MRAIEIEEDVARTFGLTEAPTLLAQRHLPRPLTFSRLRAAATDGARTTKATAPDAAFVFLVALAPVAAGEVWIDGTSRHPAAGERGRQFRVRSGGRLGREVPRAV